MSERRVLSLLLTCAALAAPVQAQDLAQLRRREAELTALRAQLYNDAGVESDRQFKSQRRSVLSVGRFHVAYPEWMGNDLGEDVTTVLEAQLRAYGQAADSVPMDTLYIGMVDAFGGSGSVGLRFRMGPVDGVREFGHDSTEAGEWVRFVASLALQRWAEDLLGLPMNQWLGPMDPRASVATLRDPLVRELVGSPSSRARRCINGTIEDCRLLLELDEGGTPLLAAYDVGDLPTVIGRMDLSVRMPGRANCIGKHDPEACAALIRQGRALPPHPVGPRARQSLFAYAVATGGDGAWLRLYRAQGSSIAQQLSAAAGKPVDSLLVSWQHDLIEGRRTTTAGLVPSLVLALLWSVGTTLFFAWRYRWRHV
jgi:hypothetical protein